MLDQELLQYPEVLLLSAAKDFPRNSVRRISTLGIVTALAQAVLVTVVCLLVVERGANAQIQVTGGSEFKITVPSSPAEIRGGAFDKAVLLKEAAGVQLRGKDGKTIASIERKQAEKSEAGSFLLKDATGTLRYTLIERDETYLVQHPDESLVNRVKLKEDKFNIYDAGANRILHGKAKPDGFGVKDQKGLQVLKIKGPQSLKEASYLAVPLEDEFRILLWAVFYLK